MIENEQPDEDQEGSAETPACETDEAGLQDILGKIGGMLPQGALDQASQMPGGQSDGDPLSNLAGLAGTMLHHD